MSEGEYMLEQMELQSLERSLYIESLAERKVWVTAAGDVLKIKNMNTVHLVNTIAMLERTDSYDDWIDIINLMKKQLIKRKKGAMMTQTDKKPPVRKYQKSFPLTEMQLSAIQQYGAAINFDYKLMAEKTGFSIPYCKRIMQGQNHMATKQKKIMLLLIEKELPEALKEKEIPFPPAAAPAYLKSEPLEQPELSLPSIIQEDAELLAIAKISRILNALSQHEVERVKSYIEMKFPKTY